MKKTNFIQKYIYLFLLIFVIFSSAYSININDITTSKNAYAENFADIQSQMNNIKLAIYKENMFDNDLLYYRQQLRDIDDRLDNASQYYQARLKKLNRIVHLFDESEAEKASSSTYNQKLESSKQAVDEFKGRLVEIKIFQAEVEKLLDNISVLRTELRNKDLFINNEPLYQASSWSHGISDIENFVYISKDSVGHVASDISFDSKEITIFFTLLLLVIYLAIIKAVLRSIFKWIGKLFKGFPHSEIKYIYQAVYILFSGLIPAFMSYFLFERISSLSVNIVWQGFFSASASSIGLYCLLYSLGKNLLFKSYNAYIQGKEFRNFKSRLLSLFLIIVSLLFFINNIHFFSLKTIISPYMGPDGTAIVDFILGIFLSCLLLCFAVYVNISIDLKQNKYASRYKFAAILAIFMAIFYPLMTFLGSSNFSSGILLNILQTFVLIYIARMAYMVIKIIIPIITSSIEKIIQKRSLNDTDTIKLEKNNFTNYWLNVTIAGAIAFIVLVTVLLVWGIQPERLYDWFEFFFIDGIPIGQDGTFSLLYLVNAVLVLVCFYYATRFVQIIVDKRVLPYTNIDSGTKHAIRTTIGYLGLALSIVMFVYALGVNSTTLTFIISGLSVGVGFALQDLFKNFFAGFVLLIERPIKVGDWVNVENDIGEVKSIRIRATVIETFNKNTLIIPNSSFVNSVVSNETLNPMSRAIVEIGVPYEADPKLVLDIFQDVANNNPRIYTQPPPSVIFNRIDSSMLIFTLRGFVNKAEQLGIETELRISILEALQKHGIRIPYPQQDIHIRSNEYTNK